MTPQIKADAASRFRAGTGGWTYAPWRSNFYPPGLVQRRELEYASRHVTAIEINGTFYGAQKPASYAAWRAQTPDGFVFSLKAPRYATERKELAGAGATIKGFVFGGLAELGDRLGPINWQLPESKRFERDDLAAFFDLLPRELNGAPLRHVIEVRDASFADPAYTALARSRNVATVFTDSPEYPSFADATGDFVYARLRCCESAIPTGYAPEALEVLRTAPDDEPLTRTVESLMPVPVDLDARVVFNVNTPQDLAEAERRLSNG
jgi:uncharacterized protein YecE (DUF72 family)